MYVPPIWPNKKVPKWYGTGPRGRGGSADWSLARLYYISTGYRFYKRPTIELSAYLINILLDHGFEHKMVLDVHIIQRGRKITTLEFTPSTMTRRPVKWGAGSPGLAKIYYTGYKGRSKDGWMGYPYDPTRARRPLYSKVHIYLSNVLTPWLLKSGWQHKQLLDVDLSELPTNKKIKITKI